MNQLRCCTFTGVDHKTDLSKLIKISTTYPFVEWGFLFSLANGLSRFCSDTMIINTLSTLPSSVLTSVHFCGKSVIALLNENAESVNNLLQAILLRNNTRIQLNFNYQYCDDDFIPLLQQFLTKYPHLHVITQYNDNNSEVYAHFTQFNNFELLFDQSGGRGISANDWPTPISNIVCGYAGGLGVDNIDEQLMLIKQVVADKPYWIDMENKLRTFDENHIDWLDLNKCANVARSVGQCLWNIE